MRAKPRAYCRRSSQRERVNNRMSCLVTTNAKLVTFTAHALNLSIAGMAITLDVPFDTNAVI